MPPGLPADSELCERVREEEGGREGEGGREEGGRKREEEGGRGREGREGGVRRCSTFMLYIAMWALQ